MTEHYSALILDRFNRSFSYFKFILSFYSKMYICVITNLPMCFKNITLYGVLSFCIKDRFWKSSFYFQKWKMNRCLKSSSMMLSVNLIFMQCITSLLEFSFKKFLSLFFSFSLAWAPSFTFSTLTGSSTTETRSTIGEHHSFCIFIFS